VMTEADSAVATGERLPAWVAVVPSTVSDEFQRCPGVHSLWIRRHANSTRLVHVCVCVLISCLPESLCCNIKGVHSFTGELVRLFSACNSMLFVYRLRAICTIRFLIPMFSYCQSIY